MKVRCVELKSWKGEAEQHSSWLKVGRIYHVLGMQIEPRRTMLQLVGDEPGPALFQPELFELVSSSIPSTWIVSSPKPGYLLLGPRAWSVPGFWERFFDGDPDAVASFKAERTRIIEAEP